MFAHQTLVLTRMQLSLTRYIYTQIVTGNWVRSKKGTSQIDKYRLLETYNMIIVDKITQTEGKRVGGGN